MEALRAMFPGYDEGSLQAVLDMCGADVAAAADFLLGDGGQALAAATVAAGGGGEEDEEEVEAEVEGEEEEDEYNEGEEDEEEGHVEIEDDDDADESPAEVQSLAKRLRTVEPTAGRKSTLPVHALVHAFHCHDDQCTQRTCPETKGVLKRMVRGSLPTTHPGLPEPVLVCLALMNAPSSRTVPLQRLHVEQCRSRANPTMPPECKVCKLWQVCDGILCCDFAANVLFTSCSACAGPPQNAAVFSGQQQYWRQRLSSQRCACAAAARQCDTRRGRRAACQRTCSRFKRLELRRCGCYYGWPREPRTGAADGTAGGSPPEA